jgi:hypothetical protein
VPTITVARVSAEGRLCVRVNRSVAEVVPVTRREVRGGLVVEVTSYVTVYRTVSAEVEHELKGVKAFEAGGKKVETSALPKLLARPTVVAVSADGRAVAAAYLRLLRPESLVLVLPVPPGTRAKSPPK